MACTLLSLLNSETPPATRRPGRAVRVIGVLTALWFAGFAVVNVVFELSDRFSDGPYAEYAAGITVMNCAVDRQGVRAHQPHGGARRGSCRLRAVLHRGGGRVRHPGDLLLPPTPGPEGVGAHRRCRRTRDAAPRPGHCPDGPGRPRDHARRRLTPGGVASCSRGNDHDRSSDQLDHELRGEVRAHRHQGSRSSNVGDVQECGNSDPYSKPST